MPGPKSDKVWSDAIRKAVHEYHKAEGPDGKVRKQRYINTLAANLVAAGAKGDIQAIKEIGDRLDGRPAQAHTHADPQGDPITFTVNFVGGSD